MFDPEEIKKMRNVNPEPNSCCQLRNRNLYGAKRRGYEEMRKLERENDEARLKDPIRGGRGQ
ncbi:hypothetical protein Vca1114GL_04741 [Vibrio campbellii]|uniref:hypothetical protein n=1 Tax=Vibrio campbellii TaxID=680 RepID=UPI00097FBA3B|nr:hypothetical protein [Vibrio campbellii]AQM71158.1 hypothetical protein Vca1114GL_04741 [Vibrio campbellii]